VNSGPAPADEVGVRDRISPGLVLTLGLAITTLAFMLWAVDATALRRGHLRHEAAAMLEEPPVQAAMSKRVADAIGTVIPAGSAVSPAVVDAVADRALEQPAFVTAFAAGLDQVQAHVADGAVNPITLDPTLVALAAREASASEPSLAAVLAPATPLPVQIPDDEVPDLARWADLLRSSSQALAFVGMILITYGVLRVEHKPWALGRIGRWAVVVGAATLLLFWAVPYIVLDAIGGWIGVAGVVIAGDGHLVPIALLLLAGGALAILGAHRWEAHDRKRFLAVIPGRDGHPASTPWQSPV
jgi:hypothetical protein